MSDQEIEEVIDKVHETYENQHTVSFTERREKLHQVAELLLADKRDYAKLMAKEMGKPITAGEYAEQAEEFLKLRIVKTKLETGGEILKSKGFYYPPTLLSGINPSQ
ncbi:aldehyde dehydrogenase family protein [Coxiella-like endosymbiont of Rhipicephalus sanguineus]|uniref:aldehyde dehydrogenase family protein n=1 Tax=Coxiella-like endosymbiont of Rhipicephalus sanguineus TaxID=1955402 RepID=UPI00203FF6CE|nr:aldehyde dehydrogenase family protein [Coxiella-like endosymbiont of Rhipicephalus sanguineus]